MLAEVQPHEDAIQDMQVSPDGGYVVTASLDRTAQLIDIASLQSLKTYKTGRYVQSAAISPLFDHVLLGGGQDASQVRCVPCARVGAECRDAALAVRQWRLRRVTLARAVLSSRSRHTPGCPMRRTRTRAGDDDVCQGGRL